MSILDWLFNTKKRKKNVAELYSQLSQDHHLQSFTASNIGLSLAVVATTYTNVAAIQGWLQTHSTLSAAIILLTAAPAAIFLISAYLSRVKAINYLKSSQEELFEAHPEERPRIENIQYRELIQADIRKHPVFYTAVFIILTYLLLNLV